MSGLLARFSMKPTRPILVSVAGATVIAAMALSAIKVSAMDLMVTYDQSQLLRITRPVAEIIIGNPTVADVTVQSKKLLVITGKSFGTTNMILLDSERNVIQESKIVVRQDQAQVVNLRRGLGRESYNCSPRCNPTITIGDETKYFKNAASNAQLKMKLSEGGSAGGGGGGGGQ